MNPEQKLKIQRNFNCLLENLLVEEIADNLYSQCVIEHDNVQRVHAEVTDRDKVRCLIHILYTTENSYEPFIRELKSTHLYRYLADQLDNTDVQKELEQGTHVCLNSLFKNDI